MSPWIVCFCGLPGVGKSTIARDLAQETGALWLRIDAIEDAMRRSHMRTDDMADGGYAAAQAVAEAALSQGFCVVADCVNPIALTRAAWQVPAQRTGAPHLDVEIVCSDRGAHRRRVEDRRKRAASPGMPDWAAVEGREYLPFQNAFQIDTSRASAKDAVHEIRREMTRLGWTV
ncbi:AAA family ATPase [Pacificoceanicola onchidii]|uniref:AAA family ATPase n=1 Tax=Pacificoceanicola onchidii TaxID=2562685 RepID=UPI0010A4D7BD|nr:AAA family ATPase [Pacificoceanicola onchidii]